MPFSPMHLLIFAALLTTLVTFIQLGVLTIAFEKLDLSPGSALTLLFMSLLGSMFNLPLLTVTSQAPSRQEVSPMFGGMLRGPQLPFTGKTLIAVNVGGAMVPLFFSLHLIRTAELALPLVLLAIALVSAVCYLVSRPVPGIGIGMPVFVAPIAAAIVAMFLSAEQSAPLAYVCGTLGVLVGADLMRLKDIRRMGAPIASIGGAGTFDGVFITGIVAVLLA